MPTPEDRHFMVIGRLPTLNEMIELRARSPHAYNRRKKSAHQLIGQQSAGLPAFKWVSVRYLFVEPTRAFDPSNLVFGAIKCIEDGLQEAGIIPGDGWEHMKGFEIFWQHEPDSHPSVVVTLRGEIDHGTTARQRARERLERQRKAATERAKKRIEHHAKHGAAAGAVAHGRRKASRGRIPRQ